jgi:hypothetical protein
MPSKLEVLSSIPSTNNSEKLFMVINFLWGMAEAVSPHLARVKPRVQTPFLQGGRIAVQGQLGP